MTKSIWLAGGAVLLAVGCKKDPTTSESIVGDIKAGLTEAKADVAAAKADLAKPAAPAKTCADYKATGKGTFEDSCKLTTAAPIEAVPLDKFVDDYGQQVRALKLVSHTDLDVDVMGVHFFYYDAAGKLLDVKTESKTQGESVKAGKTAEVPFGYVAKDEPPGTATIQAEIYQYWTQNPKLDFEAWIDKHTDDLHARPKDGWK